MKWIAYIGKVIGILLMVGILGLFMAQYRPGNGHFETSVLINRPIAVVFKALSHPEDMYAKWISGDIKVKVLTPGHMRVGTKLLLTENIDGNRVTMEEEITALNPPYLETYTTRGMGKDKFTELGEYRLTEKEGQTEFTMISQVIYHNWWLAFLEPLITPTVRHKFSGDQRILKKLLEAKSVPPQ